MSLKDVAKQMVKDCSELEKLTANNNQGIPNTALGEKYNIDKSAAGALWRGVRMGMLRKSDDTMYGKAVKQMYEDNIVENISNMSYKEVDDKYNVQGNAGMQLLKGLEAAKLNDDENIIRTDNNIPNGITTEHIKKAVNDYNSNAIKHRFADSKDYDVIIDGNKYPPKAIVGLAARYVSGELLTPKHFKGGQRTKCFKILRDNGFEVLPKDINTMLPDELRKKAQSDSKIPTTRTVTSTQHARSPWVVEYAKQRADGICQLCKKPAPFKNKKGEAYLEIHHIKWLAYGGEDSIENTVALCPNCHRRMHILNDEEDVKELLQLISKSK